MSARFQNKHFDEPFQIVECHGAGEESRAYTVSDLRGRRDGLGFSQPVALERLTPIELLPLPEVSESSPTRIKIDRGGQQLEGTIVNQSLDGKVYIRFDEADEDECVDLARSKYSWV